MTHRIALALALSLAATTSIAAGCTSNKKSEAPSGEEYEEVEMADTFEPEGAPRADSEASETLDPMTFAGPTTREALLLFPSWREALAAEPEYTPSSGDAVSRLKGAPGGARVSIYVGAWCPDSVREITKLWSALDGAESLPFPIEYVALDRSFGAGEAQILDQRIVAVPTIIVERDGAEVGRIVERPETDVVEDLAALIYGDKDGWLSSSRPAPGGAP